MYVILLPSSDCNLQYTTRKRARLSYYRYIILIISPKRRQSQDRLEMALDSMLVAVTVCSTSSLSLSIACLIWVVSSTGASLPSTFLHRLSASRAIAPHCSIVPADIQRTDKHEINACSAQQVTDNKRKRESERNGVWGCVGGRQRERHTHRDCTIHTAASAHAHAHAHAHAYQTMTPRRAPARSDSRRRTQARLCRGTLRRGGPAHARRPAGR